MGYFIPPKKTFTRAENTFQSCSLWSAKLFNASGLNWNVTDSWRPFYPPSSQDSWVRRWTMKWTMCWMRRLIERSLKRGLPLSANLSVANYSRSVWRWYGLLIHPGCSTTLWRCLMARLLSCDGGERYLDCHWYCCNAALAHSGLRWHHAVCFTVVVTWWVV